MRRLTAAFMVLAFSLAPGGALATPPEPPAIGSFGSVDPLAEARVSHTATLLPDGRVLVIGGWDGERPLASTEVWDPATASFGPAGPLAEARLSHTATLLPDGRVLVAGGQGSDGAIASAETRSLSTPLPSADPVAAVNAFLDAFVAKQWDKLRSAPPSPAGS